MIFGLYGEDAPLTTENFLQLSKGFKLKEKTVGYRNTSLDYVKKHTICGGDVILGTGVAPGLSIYGKAFPDENFALECTQPGDLLCVGNPFCSL